MDDSRRLLHVRLSILWFAVLAALLWPLLALGAPEASAPATTPTATRRVPPMAPPQSTAQPSRPKMVYLSVDDGPNPPYTAQVLDLLAQYHADATFFVVGRQAELYPDLVQRMAAEGHTVGNHTFTHRGLRGLPRDVFNTEVLKTQAALWPLGARCLRPPFGSRDALTPRYAAALGYSVVMWTIDPKDFTRPGAERIASFVLQRVRPGSIVLLHDGSHTGSGDRSQTVTALATILRTLTAQGYTFQPLCKA